jgi:hypothetical protein
MIAAGRGIIGDDGIREYMALKIFLKARGLILLLSTLKALKKRAA